MKQIFAGLTLCLVATLSMSSWADIGVDITFDRNRYLKYEPINVTLALRNDTGNFLEFGSGERRQGTLFFNVRTGDGTMLPSMRDPSELLDDLQMPPGSTKRVTFAFNQFFSLQRQADYTIYGQIRHDRTAYDYRSPRRRIEVRKGQSVWERSFGLPGQDDQAVIKTRTAILLRFSERSRDIYCLQIEDEDYVYMVHRVARHIAGSRPRGEIDGMSNIHLFMRIESRIFMHQVYDPHGELKQERFYTFDQGPPSLYRDSRTGRVSIVGGRRAVRGRDYMLPEDVEGALLEDGAPVLEPL